MTAVLDKLERVTIMAQRLEGLVEKIPRLAEVLGLAMFAGRASENVGGRFIDGAVAGVVADGLAHSNLPHNQIGGVALGTYVSGVGLLNIVPPALWEEQPVTTDPALEGEPDLFPVSSREECEARGGVYIETLLSFFGLAPGGCRIL